VEKHKGFVFERPRFGKDDTGGKRIAVKVRPRKRSKGICSNCGRRGSTYDHLTDRRFDYVPLWGIAVVLLYRMRRIDCPDCGVKVECVRFAAGKSPISRSSALFLADWARVLSWPATARRFRTNWHQVFASVRYVAEWGLARRDRYKDLKHVGQVFRTMKATDIQTRPIRRFNEKQVRGHPFACFSAYRVIWELRQRLAPMLTRDPDTKRCEAGSFAEVWRELAEITAARFEVAGTIHLKLSGITPCAKNILALCHVPSLDIILSE
jgi:hypothetical protein